MPRRRFATVTALLILLSFWVTPGAVGQSIMPDTTAESGSGSLPLEPTRTFEMTATEGSWLSLDVHPSGEAIVFGLLGDLYTLPIEGGEATRITRGMAFDSQPRYGPDGERIAFVSDRSGSEQVWVINRSENDTTQVSNGDNLRFHSPEWTPDGNYVIVSRQTSLGDPAKPWLYHVEGGSGTALVEEPEDLRLSGAAFGGDPTHVWFARRSGTFGFSYNAILPQYQLAVYDRETGDLYERSSRFGSAFRPTLSPDGQWLVYGTRHDAQTGLRIRDRTTGEERWLAYPVQRDDQESIATRDVYPGMSFTPDSEALITSYGGMIWRLPVDGGEPSQIPFTADVEIPMGPALDFEYPVDDTPQLTARQIRNAVPSPSGDRLAFTALDRLYVMEYPGGTPRRLTDQDVIEAHPTWSPDGSSIAYAAWSEEGGHLYRVPASGGAPTRITETTAVYQQPAWSPGGDRIVAVRGPARAFRTATSSTAPDASEDLVWVPANGGTATQIVPAEGRDHPHFTTNPDRVYVYGSEQGLQSMRYDGTDVKTHLKVKGRRQPLSTDLLTASLALMGPDGDQAVAQVHNSLYQVAVPMVGGEAPTVTVTDPDAASVPVRKLTTVGGQFPAWGSEGERAHFSAGNAHFRYDLTAAQAAEDSAEAAPDSLEENGKPAYTPAETRVEIEADRDIPQGTVVLRGARVITMEGGEVIETADLVVEDNRIAAVGQQGAVEIPTGADTIDVSGHTIIPGFVDTHAHLRPAWGLHKTQAWQYLSTLAYGVTTTRDPQTSTTDVLTYADKVRSGQMLGPRIYSTGPGVFQSEQIESLTDARNVLRRYSDYYDTKTVKQYVAGDREQRQWIIEAARDLELLPTTEGALDLKLDLTQIIDGYPGHEHTFPVYPLYDDVIGLTAESQTAYTPTLLVSYGGPWAENYFYTRENPHDNAKLQRFTPHAELDQRTRRRGDGAGAGPGGWFMAEEHIFDEQAETMSQIVEAGGRAGVGSHGQLQGLGYHWELWAMATGGLSKHEILRVATLTGADAIGLDQDLGSIAPGKLADLIVLRKNPLDDLRHTQTIHYVMKSGRLYDGDTLDEVYPRSRPLSTLWWQQRGPDADLPGTGRTKDGVSLDERLEN